MRGQPIERFIAFVTFDVASIVPSARDFLQAIATQRKRLALVPLIESAEEARSLVEAGVAAFAVSAPSDATRAVSEAIGPSPLVSLSPITNERDALEARYVGADAVVVTAVSDAPTWDGLSKLARSTRMAALAGVSDPNGAEWAKRTQAKGVYLRANALADVAPLMKTLGSLRVLVRLPSVDEATLRALRGVVDAVIVESDLYLSTSFESLRDELDP